jgi:hypothetical protein
MTTLTDYAIALECLLFALFLLRLGSVGWLWAAAFGGVSVAALLGGTYHGWAAWLSGQSLQVLWRGTVIALATASFFTVIVAAFKTTRVWRLGLLVLATGKLLLALMASIEPDAFVSRVVDYISALVIVLLIQVWQSSRPGHSPHPWPPPSGGTGWMTGGIALSGLAAGCLLAPWPTGFSLSPQAGYHLVQMAALYCIYRSARAMAKPGGRVGG